jgi:DNA recombination protein RmuC
MNALAAFLDSFGPVTLFLVALGIGALAAGTVAALRGRARLAEETAARRLAEAKAETLETERAHLGGRLQGVEENLAIAREERARLDAELAAERRAGAEKLAAFERAEQTLRDQFKALSGDVLKANSEEFLRTATQTFEKLREGAAGDLKLGEEKIGALVKPVDEQLKQLQEKLQALEVKREGAYAGLTQQVASLLTSQESLRSETQNLVTALRRPEGRGSWGEMHLKRAVEMAGMIDHVDFIEQQSSEDGDGARLRPDMLIRMPGGTTVVIDAKTPLVAYLDAVRATDEPTRRQCLERHARQVRDHVRKLSAKSYWQLFDPSPEFVVMFLPMESVLSAALEIDAGLIEAGHEARVTIATPTTLIALLRTVASGWRQAAFEENAREIARQGSELYQRFSVFVGHLGKVGKSLDSAVGAFNDGVGSLDRQVMPSLKRLKEMKAAPGNVEIAELGTIDRMSRRVEDTGNLAALPNAGPRAVPDG